MGRTRREVGPVRPCEAQGAGARDVGRTRHDAGLVRPCEARGAGAHDTRWGGAGARGLEAGPSDMTDVLIEALALYYPRNLWCTLIFSRKTYNAGTLYERL